MKQAGRVFDKWSRDDRAPGMEKGHWPVVKQAFDLIPETGGDCLEIGVGNGYGLHHLALNQFREGRCFGIDVAPGMVELARERLRGVPNATIEQGDFMEWRPPPGVQFSLIYSMEVFYYFSSIQAGIRKAYSLLRPGGRLMVMVDFFAENVSTHDWPSRLGVPMQLWSRRDYLEGMEKAGFVSIRQHLFSDVEGDPATGEPTLCTVGLRQ